jgi:hypothetical protein
VLVREQNHVVPGHFHHPFWSVPRPYSFISYQVVMDYKHDRKQRVSNPQGQLPSKDCYPGKQNANAERGTWSFLDDSTKT